jgi:hypothetical protein
VSELLVLERRVESDYVSDTELQIEVSYASQEDTMERELSAWEVSVV